MISIACALSGSTRQIPSTHGGGQAYWRIEQIRTPRPMTITSRRGRLQDGTSRLRPRGAARNAGKRISRRRARTKFFWNERTGGSRPPANVIARPGSTKDPKERLLARLQRIGAGARSRFEVPKIGSDLRDLVIPDTSPTSPTLAISFEDRKRSKASRPTCSSTNAGQAGRSYSNGTRSGKCRDQSPGKFQLLLRYLGGWIG